MLPPEAPQGKTMPEDRTPKGRSPYITAAGHRRLLAESAGLWTRRVDVVKALEAPA